MQYMVNYVNLTQSSDSLSWIASMQDEVRPFFSGQSYYNYIDSDEASWQLRYYGNNYDRLQDLKQRYDPENVFRGPFTIPSKVVVVE
jgi:FAD/FMN-containing dehydrogenase